MAPAYDFWRRLLKARLDQGISQAELARRLGVTQGYVAKLERKSADKLRIGWAYKYAQALRIDLHITVED